MLAVLKERPRVTSAQSGKRGRDGEERINDSRASARSEIGREETISGESAVRVLIADDHPLMLGGLRQAVLAAAPDAEIAVAHDFDSMVAALDASPDTDLVLLDLTMPGVRGFSGLLFLRSERPSTPVIVVSGNEERAVIRHCMEFGAAGFIPKTNSLDTMRTAIAQVLDGGRWTPPDFDLNAAPNGESSAMARRLASLTPQQIRVLMMLSQGLLNKQIAYELGVSEATVKAHVSAIFQKLGVESRTQAVILATKIETAQELVIAS
jgi:DNA-binding NarL/FixJ family response regulator